jgi:hypothetical protein
MSKRKFTDGQKVTINHKAPAKWVGKQGKISHYSDLYKQYVVVVLGTRIFLSADKLDNVRVAPKSSVKKTEPKKPTGVFEVDTAFIKAAHKSACTEWKAKIEKKFPEAFKPKDEYYNFGVGKTTHLSSSSYHLPIFVGNGMAPDDQEGKCIVVDDAYELEVKQHGGNTLLFFKKK